MSRIFQDIEKLEGMIDDNAEKDEIKVQLRFIATQVATLQAEYATLEQEHSDLQAAQAEPAPTEPLQHSRGIYYARGDSIPFCPRCYEAEEKRIHLFGPMPLIDRSVERWDCHTCNTYYAAKPGENFTAHPVTTGRAKT